MKRIVHHKPHSGFTLIEMMLVLVIITVMLIAAFRTLQEKAMAMQIQHAAEQSIDILSGAQQYYLEYGAWPGSFQDQASDNASNDLLTEGLIAPITHTPWDSVISLCPIVLNSDTSSTPAVCPSPTASDPTPSAQSGFFVYFNTPSIASASQVADLLPNGQVFPVTGGFQVQAYVVAGTMINAQTIQYATQIQALCKGETPATPQIPAPNCPVGWLPQIYAVPAGFASMPYKSAYSETVYNYQKLAGFYPIVNAVMNSSQTVLGWNITAQSFQEDGINYPCGAQALIAVFTRCVPKAQAGGVQGIVPNSVNWSVGGGS